MSAQHTLTLRRYAEVARLSAQLAFVNRGWLVIRTFGALVALMVPYWVWHTVYTQRSNVDGFTWADIKTYLFIAFAFGILIEDGGRLGHRITRGDIAVDLVRPFEQRALSLAEALGRAATEAVLVVTLGLPVILLIGGFALPSGALQWMLLTVSLLFAMLLKFLLSHICSLISFWTDNTYGIDRFRLALSAVLSGAIVPIALFPSWLRVVAGLLPFQGIVATPANVAISRSGLIAAAGAITLQAAWVLLLWLVAGRLWRRGLWYVAIQGG